MQNHPYFQNINALIWQQDYAQAQQNIQFWHQQEPENPIPLVFWAHILRRQQQYDVALQTCNNALQLDANNYSALLEKARTLANKGEAILACHLYIQIYQLYPNSAEFLEEWMKELMIIQDYPTLIDVGTVWMHAQPQKPEPYFSIGLAHQYLNRHLDAIPFYEKVLELDPNFPMLNNNLGAAYKETEALDKAQALFEKEITNDQNNFMAWINYASVLQKKGMLPEALDAAQIAIKLEPNYAISYNNLCLILREMQNFEAAAEAVKKAAELDPTYISAKWNLAMSYLQMGDYEKGWEFHEYRWQGSKELRDKPHNIPQSEYDGTQDVFGKSILIWGEQGFGDAIQFSRYVPAMIEKLKAKGAKIHYCCFTNVQDLFTSSFAHLLDTPIIDDKHRPLPEFDYHLPLLKMPLLLQTRVDTIPNQVPYLKPSQAALEKFAHLKNDKKLKVGLVWTGSLTHQRNPYRAVWIENYLRLGAIEDVTFYNFQFNADQDVQKAKENGLIMVDETADMQTFDDSAAAISQMDLIITVCTSTSHLAGALGVPTWVLLDVNPHWVWLLNRDDSPWYPNSKLYRQTEFLNWAPVMDQVEQDLRQLAALHANQPIAADADAEDKAKTDKSENAGKAIKVEKPPVGKAPIGKAKNAKDHARA